MRSFAEYLVYLTVRAFGFTVRYLPLCVALFMGRMLGIAGYYFDAKHRSLAYSNLKIAFARTKTPRQIKDITKKAFKNFGQNLVELLRLPLMKPAIYGNFVKIEGQENLLNSLKQGRGAIFLPMHYGSWELASIMCAMLCFPYKVLIKPQKRLKKLSELLNSYRECSGAVVVSRGAGTREVLKGLANNEVIGMVVDQGGRDGTPVRFFGRMASMSVGAIRIGLKLNVPVCFVVIFREKEGWRHRLVIHPPLELEKTGDLEKDVTANLNKIVAVMEDYIRQYPWEYMWFYKIWKYSRESSAVILSDGKAGHVRQSQAVAKQLQRALGERETTCAVRTLTVVFKNKFSAFALKVLTFFTPSYFCQGRIGCLKWFLTEESFDSIVQTHADFIISCGSSVAGVNFLLSRECRAKNISILRPGLLSFRRFDLVVLPQHDKFSYKLKNRILTTLGAPNLMDHRYLQEQSDLLEKRFPWLREKKNIRLGILLGGNTKDSVIHPAQVETILGQIAGAAQELNADILLTTSRRTPGFVEELLHTKLGGCANLKLSIIANKNNVPEAMGGILGLSDVVVVSGDSISMISEAASSGKPVIVFLPQGKSKPTGKSDKHASFIRNLQAQGYIFLVDENGLARQICEVINNKLTTKLLGDNEAVFERVRKVI